MKVNAISVSKMFGLWIVVHPQRDNFYKPITYLYVPHKTFAGAWRYIDKINRGEV